LADIDMEASINEGTPRWMVYRENPIKMDDLGVPGYPYFRKPPYAGLLPIFEVNSTDFPIQ